MNLNYIHLCITIHMLYSFFSLETKGVCCEIAYIHAASLKGEIDMLLKY
jgi:hypothetical protein